MIIRSTMPLRWIFFYAWKSLLLIVGISVLAVVLHKYAHVTIPIPVTVSAMLSAAVSIYLGFRSNNAYDRWWEARCIWGALINISRAWARQVATMLEVGEGDSSEEVEAIKKRLIYRHIAFTHALRVFLRGGPSIAHEKTKELYQVKNDIEEIKEFLSEEDYLRVKDCNNPPNMLIQMQGEDLALACKKGFLTDYRFMHLDQSLVEFNNIQGRSERIKSTAFPRAYSFFQRVFVWTHAIVVPFAFVSLLGWMIIPASFILNYVFFAIDFVSSRIEDPFENRWDDISLSAISRTVEINLKEIRGEKNLPPKIAPIDGILF
jgi:ion channel-forming bestrophin family protein